MTAEKTFKINDYLTLKLEGGKTNIYVNGVLFQQCKFLLLNIPVDKVSAFDEIESIDESFGKEGYCFIVEHPIAYVLEMFEQVFSKPKWQVVENKIQTYDDGKKF